MRSTEYNFETDLERGSDDYTSMRGHLGKARTSSKPPALSGLDQVKWFKTRSESNMYPSSRFEMSFLSQLNMLLTRGSQWKTWEIEWCGQSSDWSRQSEAKIASGNYCAR